MIPIYGDRNYQELLARHPVTEDGGPQFLPRRSIYGQASALNLGLAPIHDFPDVLIKWEDRKEIILDCIARQVFARYHQAASGVFDAGWNQNGLGYCWAFGLTAATMGCRAVEGKPAVRLAPTGLGWLVGWKNRGFFCDEAIAAAAEKGIPSAEFIQGISIKPSEFKAGWEKNGLLYRPTGWWDTRRDDGDVEMIRQCLSVLATGRPGYCGYNWWGHALEIVGMEWDEKQPNGIVWILRNSHNESDVIALTGEKGVPDEFYGVRSTCD